MSNTVKSKPETRWHKLDPAEMPTMSFLLPTEEELEQWHKLDPSEIPGPLVPGALLCNFEDCQKDGTEEVS